MIETLRLIIVTVISVTILVIVGYFLDVKELVIGDWKLVFREQWQRTSKLTTSIATKISDFEDKLASLEHKLCNPLNCTNAEPRSFTKEKNVSDGQLNKDITAALADFSRPIVPGDQSMLYLKTGFIFIGNYDKNQKRWTKTMLKTLGGQKITATPEEATNKIYRTSGNMYLREEQPKNDKQYFRNIPALGVVPRGTRIKITTVPVPIDREYAVQYWAEVTVLE